MSQSAGPSRLPPSNSVSVSTAENRPSEDSGYEERVEERAKECVEEFCRKYPELAHLPVSNEPGQSVREELVEEVIETELVEPESEFEQGFIVERLDRHEVATWAEAMFEFLTSRQRYDDGFAGRFESPEGEEFDVSFKDCWTSEYAAEQRARNAGAQRQLMGGGYPDREESECAGEVTDGEWTDDVATILLTRTGSSEPDGERVPPVDHINQVGRTWSQGGVYDRVRNVCEFELGLDSDEWEYVRSDDVHGLNDEEDSDGPGGVNACYVHSHDVIFIDLSGTDLREEFGSDEEVRAVLEEAFYSPIERHVEVCDLAKPAAHTKEKAVEVRLDLQEPAAYASKYALLGDGEEEMMERGVEFQAFATIEWAANRQRIARSNGFNDAARADFCIQSEEQEHGGQVEYDRHGNVQCAHCNSGVGIEAETISEHRLEKPKAGVRDEEGRTEKIGVSIGEGTSEAAVRSRVEQHVERYGEPDSVPAMMGELGISQEYRNIVDEVLSGECSADEIEPVMGVGSPPEAGKNELKALVLPDGGTREIGSAAGGGADMVELELPVERLKRETRLRYHGEVGQPKIVLEDESDRFATYDPDVAAGWLDENGYREPWHAELALSFVRYSEELESVFEEPVSEPPPG